MGHAWVGALACWLVLARPSDALAQEELPAAQAETAADAADARPEERHKDYYYYNADGFGAHAFYNPQNFIVQGGLGALYEERVDEFDWLGGFATVSRSLVRPVKAVDEYGWGRFFYREFVPHYGPGQNYVPNWVWHFMGGGMRTKLMEEFYTDRGVAHPRLLAWLTMYSYHYLNEAVQAARFRRYKRRTVDAVADMYFFDWAGGLLFKFDPVNRFMSRTLHMREWSYQAQYNPMTQRLFNNGQLYWLRLELFAPLSLSFLTGEQITSLNLTFGWGAGHQLSAGTGPQSKSFIAQKNGDTDPAAIVFNVGVYYSKDDNPLVTFTYEPNGRHGREREHPLDGRYLLNVYPSVVRIRGRPLGMTLAYHRKAMYAGVAFGPSPVGLVLSTPALDES